MNWLIAPDSFSAESVDEKQRPLKIVATLSIKTISHDVANTLINLSVIMTKKLFTSLQVW